MGTLYQQSDAHAQRAAEYEVLRSVDPRGEEGRDHAMSLGVYAVRSKTTGLGYVEKRIATSRPSQRAAATRELRALDKIHRGGGPVSLNAIRAFYWLDDVKILSLYLEYCDQGTAEDLIQYTIGQSIYTGQQIWVQEDLAWHILSGLAEALTFLHCGMLDMINFTVPTHNQHWDPILHFDIKPSNVFFSSQYRHGARARVVLGDFGCSHNKSTFQQSGATIPYVMCGTPGYRPPEQDPIYTPTSHLRVGEFCDIWQVGGTIQAICRLQPCAIQTQCINGWPLGSAFAQDLNDMVNGAMYVDYQQRPTAVQLARSAKTVMLAKGIYTWPATRTAS